MRKIRYIALLTAGVVSIFVITAALNPDFKVGRSMEILVNVFRDINYLYVDETDPDKLLKDAIGGITSSLDPYTEFLAEEDMEDFEFATTGKYGGIGALIRQKGDWVYIAQPYEGFPADKAGLEIGDMIIAIDGESAEGIGSSKVSSLLKGDPGTTVSLTIKKFYTGKEEQIEIQRQRIAISGIPYYGFVNDSIAYIQHSDFTEDCSSDMRNALMELRKDGRMKGLILDYRGNGGGILQEAVKILSLFVPKGTEVVSMRGRTEDSKVVFHTETDPVDTTTPIIVLTNSGSASAAEIVAGALQDLDRAVVVGQRTFGKGLVQSTKSTGYNSYLKITTAKYYIPSGRCVQAIDYAHRNEDGSVGYIPDSLINEFKTANGRKVYDGGGVMPDVRVDPSYVSRFTIIAYSKGYIEDFADIYSKKNTKPVDPLTFKLTDADYEDFISFMQDKDVDYQSETASALRTLREKAVRERYIDRIEQDLKDIESRLKDDKQSNLKLYRDQISELIEDNIILRQHYQKGVTQHSLRADTEVAEAVKVLSDNDRYSRIISTQDTTKR